MTDDPPTKEEILECLSRSGYMLESRLVAALVNNGFFVEPNQVILDKNTGKSRELDIIAEKSIHTPEHKEISVRSFFIIEAVNNTYPLILTTPRPFSPNAPFEFDNMFYASTENDMYEVVDYETRIDSDSSGVYSQYCSITRKRNKNGELMASHSDDLYSSFSKMTQYCSDEVSGMYERGTRDGYWRLWYWRPILVLQNELMVLDENNNHDYSLRNVNKASLEFNYHDEENQSSICIDIVVEDSLIEHMNKIIQQDESTKAKLAEHRHEKT